ncbi:hypothetical protein LCGC14_1701880 [marine sediment metagenome]|uniref:DNA methylase N-4/N-6 domain-containing protein n=1 Tax=marine sediment metagenome TaxID=412755 RepID=A0A0F9HHG2_9ZZZZ
MGFAEKYDREKLEGMDLIIFPRDVEWRRELFPKGVFEHPAKMNMFLCKELIEHLTKPGDTILDPFAGTGTLLIGVLMGRNVALIEIEPHYLALLRETETIWKEGVQLTVTGEVKGPGRIFIYEGDCKQKLQDIDFLCDAAIFSPPYSTSITRAKPLPSLEKSVKAYTVNPQNMGNFNPFYFQQGMKMVYERMFKRLVPGAPVAVISRDMVKGTREFLSEGMIRYMGKAGFDLDEWHKWKPPGSAQRRIQESRGAQVVKDEDILIFRRKE